MESQVKFQSSQNILRAPQQNKVAVFSQLAEVGGKFWKENKHEIAPHSLASCPSLRIHWFEKTIFTLSIHGQACATTSDGVHVNNFSLAATAKVSS